MSVLTEIAEHQQAMYHTITHYLFPSYSVPHGSNPSAAMPEPDYVSRGIVGTIQSCYYGPVTTTTTATAPNEQRQQQQWPEDDAIGVAIHADGSRYQGSWKNKLYDGYGVTFDADNHKKHEGWRKEGRNDGYGIDYYSNGVIQRKGWWENGNYRGGLASTTERYRGEKTPPTATIPPQKYASWLAEGGAARQHTKSVSAAQHPEMHHTITHYVFPNQDRDDDAFVNSSVPIRPPSYVGKRDDAIIYFYFGPTDQTHDNKPQNGAIGVMVYRDGSRYEGSFRNSKRHFYGVYYSSDNKKVYAGEWSNESKDGYGVEYETDGETEKRRGCWEKGRPISRDALPTDLSRLNKHDEWLKKGGIVAWFHRDSEWRRLTERDHAYQRPSSDDERQQQRQEQTWNAPMRRTITQYLLTDRSPDDDVPEPDSVFKDQGTIQYCYYGPLHRERDGPADDAIAIRIDKDGSRYEGKWKRKTKHGYGESYFPNGKKSYQGWWKKDLRDGYGIEYTNNGTEQKRGWWVSGKYRGTRNPADENEDEVDEGDVEEDAPTMPDSWHADWLASGGIKGWLREKEIETEREMTRFNSPPSPYPP